MEWILGILSSFFLALSLFDLYRKYYSITKYSPKISKRCQDLSLSIVLCTEGAAPRLLTYLDRILHQDYDLFELIIVCKNTPLEILDELQQKSMQYEKLRIENISSLKLPFVEKKQALNYGIALAKNDWIVTIDDDCYPASERWLASISQHIQYLGSDILLGISPYISQHGIVNQWIRYDAFQSVISYLYYTLLEKPYMGVGRNMAFKKELWSKEYLAHYSDIGSGDDTTLVNYYKSKKKIDVFIDEMVYSFPHTSIIGWVTQKLRHVNKGKFMDRSMQINLAKILLYRLCFWFCIWLWMSYFAFHFYIILLIFIYLSIQFYFYLKIARHIHWKFRPLLYLPFFDISHTLMLLILPLLSVVWREKWRSV